MAVRAADEHGVQCAGEAKVVQVGALAAEQLRILDPLDASAHILRNSHAITPSFHPKNSRKGMRILGARCRLDAQVFDRSRNRPSSLDAVRTAANAHEGSLWAV